MSKNLDTLLDHQTDIIDKLEEEDKDAQEE